MLKTNLLMLLFSSKWHNPTKKYINKYCSDKLDIGHTKYFKNH